MENEIGEYGRTNLGRIIKFAWIADEEGKKYENKVILVDLMLKETYPYYYFKNGEYIVKHSPNLIDLIQCGDYVNGHLVIDISGDESGAVYLEQITKGALIPTLKEDIQTIVTKEMMESISYKVERKEQ